MMAPGAFVRQLWNGHRVLLSVAGLLLSANLILGLALQAYLVPTVNSREQQLIRLRTELRGGGDSPAELLAQGEKDLAAFRERIPPYREFTRLVGDLQTLADDSGLDLDQVSYEHKPEKGSDLLRSTVTFTLEGQYRDIKQFIHALEQSSRLIIINEIGLQSVGQEGTDVKLQLSLDTFFRTGVS